MKRMNYTGMPQRKPRTKKEMLGFLKSHFRYWTMNSWNLLESYAVNIKLGHLGLAREEADAVWKMFDVKDAFEESGYNSVLLGFAVENKWEFQIGHNGRSGGYAVLYSGGRKPSDLKSRCLHCGQANYTSVAKTGKRCGRCGKEAREDYPVTHTVAYTDTKCWLAEEDLEEADADSVRRHFDIVWAFDLAVEGAVAAYVAYAMENEVVEETECEMREVLVKKAVSK